jgi:hypothetical protein
VPIEASRSFSPPHFRRSEWHRAARKAWRAHHRIADGEKLPLAFIRVNVDLFNDKKAAQAIVEAVGLLEAMTDLQCRAVAIDTVNAVTPGMDEKFQR